MVDHPDDLLTELENVLSADSSKLSLADPENKVIIESASETSLAGIPIESDPADESSTSGQSDLSSYFNTSGNDDDFFARIDKAVTPPASPKPAERENVSTPEPVDLSATEDDSSVRVIRHRTISLTSESSDVNLVQTNAVSPVDMVTTPTGLGPTTTDEDLQWMLDRMPPSDSLDLSTPTKEKKRSRVRFLEEDEVKDTGDQGSSKGGDGSGTCLLGDAERCREAWLPSESTRQVLATVLQRQFNTTGLDARLYTRPGLGNCDLQGDPIRNMLIKQGGESAANLRQSVSADQVTQDINGIRDLINDGWFRAAIDLTGRLLTACGQGFGKAGQANCKITQKSLQLWLTRFALLIKTKQFQLAETEMSAFGNLDNPDLYFEFYPELYPERSGSMVPFSFRLLHAELPYHLNKLQDSLDRLYYLRAVIVRILTNLKNGYAEDGSETKMTSDYRPESIRVWEEREIHVLSSVLNVFLLSKDYPSAIEVVHFLMQRDAQHRPTFISMLARIYMQMGDLDSASYCFDQSIISLDKTSNTVQAKVAFQKALLQMGRNNFDDAKRFFKDCIDLQPSNALAVNNFSVCCLYLGQLHEAIRILETLLRDGHIHDMLVFNLCTLYELESSRAATKKVKVLERIARIPGDVISVSSVKINN